MKIYSVGTPDAQLYRPNSLQREIELITSFKTNKYMMIQRKLYHCITIVNVQIQKIVFIN